MQYIRKEILELQALGKMPTESLNDDETIDLVINNYDNLLNSIQKPISYEEGLVLIQLFPDGFFYDLHWDLLQLIESILIENVNTDIYDNYLILINQCKSDEWREILTVRLENWKKKNEYKSADLQ